MASLAGHVSSSIKVTLWCRCIDTAQTSGDETTGLLMHRAAQEPGHPYCLWQALRYSFVINIKHTVPALGRWWWHSESIFKHSCHNLSPRGFPLDTDYEERAEPARVWVPSWAASLGFGVHWLSPVTRHSVCGKTSAKARRIKELCP